MELIHELLEIYYYQEVVIVKKKKKKQGEDMDIDGSGEWILFYVIQLRRGTLMGW